MENNNSVCFTTTIKEIKEIVGADNIVQAIIGGWSCITKKGEYQAGDLVIIATTDAVIPQDLAKKLNIENYLRKRSK